MADLTPIEQAIIQAMQELGATKETVIKTADDITKKSNRPKGLVTNALVTLMQKGVIKRVAREKAAGYYILKRE
ncbi:MAG: transcriptional regulator [Candidatus Micrarchaeaceae archaeon]|jgi:predicted transcriptional regulator|nr:transcriptional regulator [Candidatus Micrarchaeota archaeon]HII10339.1 transcriptional regulator [Candidatus Micrarchaeota archaeon]